MRPLSILHKDPDFLVVNKPGGLLSVPGRGPQRQDCVTRRIAALFHDDIAQAAVHRLDMATSGIMLLARNSTSHRILSQQFAERLVHKEYLALLDGEVKGQCGTIELAFRLDPNRRPYQVYDPIQGKPGISHWRKLHDHNGQSLILFSPITGRTHQLRLHAAHPRGLGVPILGDFLYGDAEDGAPMYLHASRISLLHPRSGERISFRSEPLWRPKQSPVPGP